MIPIQTNLKLKSIPWITYLLIALNVGVHFSLIHETDFELGGLPVEFFSFKPKDLTALNPVALMTVLTSVFLHGDFWHLAGNMLFLFAFGRRLEDEIGRKGYITLYLSSGVMATLTHTAMNPQSWIPVVGASGAISGVMGAFFLRNPRARISLLLDPVLMYFLRRFTIRVPAWIFIPFWFYMQVSGALTLGMQMIAFWAHIGGFMAGALMAIAIYSYAPGQNSIHKKKAS